MRIPYQRGMQRHTSIYLDLIRFSAAFIVFIGHISAQRFTGRLGWQFAPFMDDAVMVFFVLSGYVIAHATLGRETSLRAYGVARAARIYSVAIPAIVFTLVADRIGTTLRPDLYTAEWGYGTDLLEIQFLGAALFINQFWYWDLWVGSNHPYWSLCFEVWYYVIFGAMLFMRDAGRWIAVALVGVMVGPRILALLPIWLMGLAAYRISASGRVGRPLGMLLFAGSVLLIIAHQVWKATHGALLPFAPDLLMMPQITDRYVTGILVAIHLVGFSVIGAAFIRPLAALATPIRWLAGATFTIYLFHLPLAQLLASIVPWPPEAWQTRLVMLGGSLLIMLAIAEFTERRKDMWRRWCERIIPAPAAERPGLGAQPQNPLS